MPELAEVALFARDLSELSRNSVILKVSFPNRNDWGNIIVPDTVRKQLKGAVGKKVFFESTGKALHMSIKGAGSPLIEFRLGMTGQFHLSKTPGSWDRHYFLSIEFENGAVHFADPRRFGRVIEPVLTEYSLGGYRVKSGFTKVKTIIVPDGYLRIPRISWLLNHGDRTGVGNYMANEALGRLNLSPFVPCESRNEAIKILRKCRDIAQKSFQHGGNSFGSGYFLLNGDEGNYLKFCRFYQNPRVRRELFRGRPVFTKFLRE